MHRNMHSDMKSQVGMNEGGSAVFFVTIVLHMDQLASTEHWSQYRLWLGLRRKQKTTERREAPAALFV